MVLVFLSLAPLNVRKVARCISRLWFRERSCFRFSIAIRVQHSYASPINIIIEVVHSGPGAYCCPYLFAPRDPKYITVTVLFDPATLAVDRHRGVIYLSIQRLMFFFCFFLFLRFVFFLVDCLLTGLHLHRRGPQHRGPGQDRPRRLRILRRGQKGRGHHDGNLRQGLRGHGWLHCRWVQDATFGCK